MRRHKDQYIDLDNVADDIYAVLHHQQPDVNYIQVIEKVDFPCMVNAQHLLIKGNQLRAGTG